jgi:hypothetical protein
MGQVMMGQRVVQFYIQINFSKAVGLFLYTDYMLQYGKLKLTHIRVTVVHRCFVLHLLHAFKVECSY